MEANRVLLLDDDDDVREAISDLVCLLGGGSCVPVGSVSELVAARERVLDCTLAILDVNLGHDQPSGVAACEWLRAQGFAGAILFLTGHAATDPRVRDAARLADARVASKPIGLAELRALLHRAAA